VSVFGDDQDMRDIQDELLLAGRPVASEPELTAFVAALRVTAAEPAPGPNAALAAVLRNGLPPASAAPPVQVAVGRARNPLRWVAGLGLAAKILLGAGVAVASVTGAATIPAVPGALQRPALAVVHGVVGLFAPDAVAPAHAPAPRAPRPAATPSPIPGTRGGAPVPAPTAPAAAPPASPAPAPAPAPAATPTPSDLIPAVPGMPLPAVPKVTVPAPPPVAGGALAPVTQIPG